MTGHIHYALTNLYHFLFQSLGNNDVEKGSDELSPFMKNIQTKILASNVILKSTKDNENVQKFVVIDINGVRVGIVGYLTPETEILDADGDIEYIDEVLAVREEVCKLQALNVNIVIALGHSTQEKDLEIAREVEGLDFVIAGQKNKFYWDGSTVNDAAQEQPTVVVQQYGKSVLVIPSTSYSKHLGKFLAEFNDDGEMIKWNSEPILLSDVPQDEEALQIVNAHYEEITTKSDEVLGNTAVVLDGSSCKTEECNLGNLITDAIVYYYATRFEGERWTDAPVAIIHGGALAGSIAPANRPASVTRGDLLAALPLESNLVAVTMTGEVLNQVLEHSVSTYNTATPTGQLLQFSGIRATYDMSREPGSRLVEAVVRCWACFVPEYFVIDDWRPYKVLMPAALVNGEFGYSMLLGQVRETLAFDEVTATAEYIGLRSPVYPEVAERVVLNNVDDNNVETTDEPEEPTTDEPEEPTTDEPEEPTTPEPGAASGLTASALIVASMPLLLNLRNF